MPHKPPSVALTCCSFCGELRKSWLKNFPCDVDIVVLASKMTIILEFQTTEKQDELLSKMELRTRTHKFLNEQKCRVIEVCVCVCVCVFLLKDLIGD